MSVGAVLSSVLVYMCVGEWYGIELVSQSAVVLCAKVRVLCGTCDQDCYICVAMVVCTMYSVLHDPHCWYDVFMVYNV